jgi:hypothetical protein
VARLLLLNNKRLHFRLMCFVRAQQNSIASTAIKQWPICIALNARTQAHGVLGYQADGFFAVRLYEAPFQGEAAGAPVQGQPSASRSKQGRRPLFKDKEVRLFPSFLEFVSWFCQRHPDARWVRSRLKGA